MPRRLLVLVALILLVAGVVIYLGRGREEEAVEPPPAFREDAGAPPANLPGPTLAVPEYEEGGELILSWSDVDGADEYEIRIYGPDRSEIAKFSPTPSLSRLLQPEEVPSGYPRGTVLGWDVTALYGGTPIARSRPGALQIR